MNKFKNIGQNKIPHLLAFVSTKKVLISATIGLIFCIVMSFVFHFAFEWLNKTPVIAWLFATNESVWEHGKIIFYPFLIFSLIEYLILKPNIKVFLTAESLPLILCIPIMITLFYTYSGIIGKNFVAVDISIAVLVIIAMNIASYKIIANNYASKFYYLYAIIAFITMLFLIIFTYFPPHINLFYDTLKSSYGFI